MNRLILSLASSMIAVLMLMGAPALARSNAVHGQQPVMLDGRLGVRTYASGFTTPTGMVFLAPNETLVIEKNTGKVKHVIEGRPHDVALDLPVNYASERGLLSIALDPAFATNHYVYLYWTCKGPAANGPYFPAWTRCPDEPGTGADTDNVLAVPLLGNRVDRFVWDGSRLAFDHNLSMLRAFQNDAAPLPFDQGDDNQPILATHDGGTMAFGPDGKLYVFVGDAGRRGQMQNMPAGPTETGLGVSTADDQFGGPQPDDAHLTGVVLRLNSDGSTPADNPFYEAAATMQGEAAANVQRLFAYGMGNGIGMAFDPLSGRLWAVQNGEDAFDEINLVEPGMNGGWIQVQGPLVRLYQYKDIESRFMHDEPFLGLQQLRWGPQRLADSPREALSRLYALPGSHYSDPKFSWKYLVPPCGLGFMSSQALGPDFYGDMFTGSGEDAADMSGGFLFRFDLTSSRTEIAVRDDRLRDHVADNFTFEDPTESESLLIGRNFGILPSILTGPNGNLLVVSLTHGTIYEIYKR